MGSSTKTISYRYDANRNRTLMIDPDGGRTTYAYDALNRITSLINPQGERTTYAYDAKGRRTVKKLANGTRASFTYDAANRITTLANLKSDNTVISKFDYKYDKVGNRTEVSEADGSRVTWSYDATYQLTAEHRTGTVPYRNTFTYDSVGNRLVKNETGARTTYSYDAANQLQTSIDAAGTTTYTFDADGNQELVQAPNNDRTSTVWDYENKTTLIELPSGIRNTMAYEADGLRVKLEDSTGTKKFIWDNQNYLAESDENNDINVVYTNEPNYYGHLISQYRKTGTIWTPSYHHYEALGSIRELTDATAAITDQYLYDAWGNKIASSGTTINPFQWTGNVGYYFDFDTGNQYIRARIYSPKGGRWLSVDPAGFEDGTNLFEAVFIPGGKDPSGLLTILPIPGRQLLGNLPCPSSPYIDWDFRIDYRFRDPMNGRMVTGAPCKGWIVQEVYFECYFKSCNNLSDPLDTTGNGFTYYEAWPVAYKNRFSSMRPGYTDRARGTFGTGRGIYRQFGTVEFYCENGRDDPTGQGIGTGNLAKKWGTNPEGFGREPCNTTAGHLASTSTRPGFLFNAAVDGPEKRSFTVGWLCCKNCEPLTPGVGASASPS